MGDVPNLARWRGLITRLWCFLGVHSGSSPVAFSGTSGDSDRVLWGCRVVFAVRIGRLRAGRRIEARSEAVQRYNRTREEFEPKWDTSGSVSPRAVSCTDAVGTRAMESW